VGSGCIETWIFEPYFEQRVTRLDWKLPMISDVDKASAGLADHPFIGRWTWIIHIGKVFLI
jgi:hypothetical protein